MIAVAQMTGAVLSKLHSESNIAQATPQYMDWKNQITLDPEKRGGKPCIRGLRMTLYDVLESLASGMSEAGILKDFPDLTGEDIRTGLAFAADRE